MSRSAFIPFFCIALLLASGHTAIAQMNTHSLRGLVAQSEVGLEGIQVTIFGPKNDTTVTDMMGEFVFSELPNGTYTISPTAEGYRFEPETHSLTLSPTGGSFLPIFNAVTATSIDEQTDALTTPVLFPNAPNPFTHRTTLRYQVQAPGHVELGVYDVLGRHISTLRDAFHQPGLYELSYVPVDLPAGLYFIRLHTPSRQLTRSMILAK